MSVDYYRLAWTTNFLMVGRMPRQPSLEHFPQVNKAKEGHPITQTHRQAEWRLAAATGSTGNAFVAWKKSKSIITYFTATAALARSLRLHRRRGRNGAAAPWPQVPTCQMDSPQHKQLRLFVLLMKRPLARICEGKRTARSEPPS